ncbi:MAG: hypothetical protein JJU34_20500 [Lunatimonas sp.]|uniref:hypothetical protein n=1 Tax=Lunatimonas sp. TaxID=2060141 RepID=UPI00263AB641|nr:hypothetical protein [Lunatimonas sp.]MCC5939673.1 hypothetical protein [Lunatimonas sp.]
MNYSRVLFLGIGSLVLWMGLSSCSSDVARETTDFSVRFDVVDSLVIDYLGELTLLNERSDGSEFLLYDFRASTYVRVSEDGTIHFTKKLEKDGKDNHGDVMVTAGYFGDSTIAVFGMQGYYLYDLRFNLKEKKSFPFQVYTNSVGGAHGIRQIGDFLFTSRYPEDLSADFFEKPDYLAEFPYLTLYDWRNDEIRSEQYIPVESKMIQRPGKYREPAPHALLQDEELLLLFYYSPEIYRYSLPSLELLGSMDLQPSTAYSQVVAVSDMGRPFEQFFSDLAGSSYFHFSKVGSFLLAGYKAGVPQTEVDALPRDRVGGPKFMELVEKYKKNHYQLVLDGKKVWEGPLEVEFRHSGQRLYAHRNLKHRQQEEELDYVVLYFYDISLEPSSSS